MLKIHFPITVWALRLIMINQGVKSLFITILIAYIKTKEDLNAWSRSVRHGKVELNKLPPTPATPKVKEDFSISLDCFNFPLSISFGKYAEPCLFSKFPVLLIWFKVFVTDEWKHFEFIDDEHFVWHNRSHSIHLTISSDDWQMFWHNSHCTFVLLVIRDEVNLCRWCWS